MTAEQDDEIIMTDNPVEIAALAIAVAVGTTMLFTSVVAVVGCILVTLCSSQIALVVILGMAVMGTALFQS